MAAKDLLHADGGTEGHHDAAEEDVHRGPPGGTGRAHEHRQCRSRHGPAPRVLSADQTLLDGIRRLVAVPIPV
eukprot:7627222-Pyramimonas_sp.AAC.1